MILFPTDTLNRTEVERDYEQEWDAAREVGFATALFDFDALRRGESLAPILRRVPETDVPRILIYRGWMLNVHDYARLFNGLQERGWTLVTDAKMYHFAHHAPENYDLWKEWMPQTVWIGRDKFGQSGEVRFTPIFEVLRTFGNSPVIVKDWVKSQKHRWDEACFIPDANDENAIRRVVSRFLDLQGEYLTGGLVFRRFQDLRLDESGQALEWRSFWLDGELLSLAPNPSGHEVPPTEQFLPTVKSCPSRFLTLDLAQREDGSWLIIEMGDGGVSGLPPTQSMEEWYANLKRHTTR